MPETRYARTADGFHVAYQVFGEGPIDLVFLSSWVSQIEHIWAWPAASRFYRRLARFARVIPIDKRGSGLSDRIDGTPGLDERMDDVLAVMGEVGSERAALLGTSEGGALGAVFAASHPDRSLARVMLGSGPRFGAAADWPCGFSDQGRIMTEWYIEHDWGSGHAAGIWAPDLIGNEEFPRWYAQMERLAGSPGTMLAAWRWIVEIDIRAVLPVIGVPTLVLHRVGDANVPVEAGRYLASHIPRAKLVELPGSEHYAFVGDVDGLVEEVEEFLTGTRSQVDSDRLLATVLFTDIVGSTKRAAELGDRRWHDLLEEHHALLRRNLDVFHGREIKTTGDGVLATFDGPARAVRCATALRDDVRGLGLEIRAGLHTGEVEVMGPDIAGIAVHIGQRVSALADPGEVLVSRTVVDLVTGSGIRFKNRGQHELKGVPDEWSLFAVEG